MPAHLHADSMCGCTLCEPDSGACAKGMRWARQSCVVFHQGAAADGWWQPSKGTLLDARLLRAAPMRRLVLVCVECPAGKINTSSHDVPGGNTASESTTCEANEMVLVHVCPECLARKTSTDSQDATGCNTA